MAQPQQHKLPLLEIPLERDVFTRTLIGHLASTLEEVIGLREASGFLSVVGQKMGEEINDAYKCALHVPSLDRAQVSAVCVDLKRRIRGDFYVVHEDDEKIVFGNRVCPFGDKVTGRPSLCMMTSNVFGTIAAENLGYGKVVLNETIANGAQGCTVTIYLRRSVESSLCEGREYLKSEGL